MAEERRQRLAARADAKLKGVVISEKWDKKAQQFTTPSVPFPYNQKDVRCCCCCCCRCCCCACLGAIGQACCTLQLVCLCHECAHAQDTLSVWCNHPLLGKRHEAQCIASAVMCFMCVINAHRYNGS